ncbi:hypothetical protein SCACP_21380 [Sporomusa carbonis]|uniref:hypothetical protein n=1 Tax=Sporomusa carbonis TaxID=3076075 RepID=UPI003A65B81C
MSTPLLLVDELCTVAQAATADLMLETESGTLVPARVIPGFLDEDEPKPGKPPDDTLPVPFLIVRYLTSEDTGQGGTATVKFIATTYSKHGQGWRDPLELLERIRQGLLKNRTVAKKFWLEFPIKCEMPEDRPWPYSVAWMTTNWTIAQPIEEVDYGDEYFKD